MHHCVSWLNKHRADIGQCSHSGTNINSALRVCRGPGAFASLHPTLCSALEKILPFLRWPLTFHWTFGAFEGENASPLFASLFIFSWDRKVKQIWKTWLAILLGNCAEQREREGDRSLYLQVLNRFAPPNQETWTSGHGNFTFIDQMK